MSWYDTNPAAINETLPSGKYQAIISKVAVKETKNGQPYLNATLHILQPDAYRKRTVFIKWFYCNDNAIPYVKRDWETHLDIHIEDPENMDEDDLYKFIGNVVEINLTKKQDGEYTNQNIFINKFIKRYDPEQVPDIVEGEASDSDDTGWV